MTRHISTAALAVTLFFFAFFSCAASEPVEIRVAVSANFFAPIKALTSRLQEACECRLSYTVGASGALAAQFAHGAPYDLFLSADAEKPQWLYHQGLTHSTPVTYAVGKLVLVDRHRTSVSLADLGKATTTMSAAKWQIAIANPQTAPYGLAAQNLLSGLPNIDHIQLIKGNNVMQAMQFYITGAVDQAIVSASLLADGPPTVGSAIAIPRHAHLELLQQGVINRNGNIQLAEVVLATLTSKPVQLALTELGYYPAVGEGNGR